MTTADLRRKKLCRVDRQLCKDNRFNTECVYMLRYDYFSLLTKNIYEIWFANLLSRLRVRVWPKFAETRNKCAIKTKTKYLKFRFPSVLEDAKNVVSRKIFQCIQLLDIFEIFLFFGSSSTRAQSCSLMITQFTNKQPTKKRVDWISTTACNMREYNSTVIFWRSILILVRK